MESALALINNLFRELKVLINPHFDENFSCQSFSKV